MAAQNRGGAHVTRCRLQIFKKKSIFLNKLRF
jgi:hypothetical protein